MGRRQCAVLPTHAALVNGDVEHAGCAWSGPPGLEATGHNTPRVPTPRRAKFKKGTVSAQFRVADIGTGRGVVQSGPAGRDEAGGRGVKYAA